MTTKEIYATSEATNEQLKEIHLFLADKQAKLATSIMSGKVTTDSLRVEMMYESLRTALSKVGEAIRSTDAALAYIKEYQNDEEKWTNEK